jgi:translation initiation factor 2 alpha subunit (eIF-2alpha)
METLKTDDIVMCRVDELFPTHVMVSLLEFEGLPAMLSLPEISRTRIKSLRKEISVGAIEPMLILNVSLDSKYIDVSKKRVTEEDREKCKEQYRKMKMIDLLVSSLSITLQQTKQQIRTVLHVPLSLEDRIEFFGTVTTLTCEDETIDGALKKYVELKFMLVPIELTVYFTVGCDSEDFLQVKNALIELQTMTNSTIRFVQGSIYSLIIESLVENDTRRNLVSSMEKVMEKYPGVRLALK